jgi:hypothetical protein
MAHNNRLTLVTLFALIVFFCGSYLEARIKLWAVGSTEKVRASERRSRIKHPVWNEQTNTVVLKGARAIQHSASKI